VNLQHDRSELRALWRREQWHAGRTLFDELSSAVATHPHTPIVFDSATRPTSTTAAEIFEAGLRLAGQLVRLGLRPGDVVACQLPNWVEGAITMCASMTAGLVFLPIVHVYGAAELSYILPASRARVLVMPENWRGIDFVARLGEVRTTGQLDHVIVVGGSGSGVHLDWEALMARTTHPVDSPVVKADDRTVLLYTSGTSAEPKGVWHTHNSLLAAVSDAPVNIARFRPDIRHMSPSPAGHIASLLVILRGLLQASQTVLMDAWDPQRALDLCLRHRPLRMNGAPFFFTSLFEAEQLTPATRPWPSTFQTGGASVPPTLILQAEATGRKGWRHYGSSEIPSMTSSEESDPLWVRSETDGVPVRGTRLRIVDDDDVVLPTGRDGHVLAIGPQAFDGYDDEDMNESAFAAGGWFRTGDIGRVDESGRLTVTGRSKDIVIRGGENVSSKEVEDVLASHPSVVEAAVISVPDAKYGERLCAVVRLRPGTHLTLDEVRTHFRQARVAVQKTPENLVISDQPWPRTESGKVKKDELRRLIADRV
jgi:acyl-CoA synthetase (AMP-forming)/AMP-acid ligase II